MLLVHSLKDFLYFSIPCSPLLACPRKRQARQFFCQKIGGSCLPPGHASPKIGDSWSPTPPREISQNCSWALDKRQAIRNIIRGSHFPPLKPHGETLQITFPNKCSPELPSARGGNNHMHTQYYMSTFPLGKNLSKNSVIAVFPRARLSKNWR